MSVLYISVYLELSDGPDIEMNWQWRIPTVDERVFIAQRSAHYIVERITWCIDTVVFVRIGLVREQ